MIKIVADTLSCISVAEAKDLDVALMPQIIIFGDESFRDDFEIDTAEFLRKLRASPTLPKTAAPSPALYEPIFQEFSGEGNTIIVICPSNELSGTFRSASVAAQEFPNADIRVIDTRTIASALGYLVKLAVQWVNQGLDADVIIQKLEETSKSVRIYFYVETLEYLFKGGRIGAASTLMGSLLQVKPILAVRDGKILPFERQRTQRKALDRLVEIVKTECPADKVSSLSLVESDALKTASEVRETLISEFNIKEIGIYTLPPAIVVHVGPGAIGACFLTN
jgi:DegV family protein with EDD domain